MQEPQAQTEQAAGKAAAAGPNQGHHQHHRRIHQHNQAASQQQQMPIQSNYAASIAKSMTITEMRNLHRGALQEAESKNTELRLVLASRYRELVGSSDEVISMQQKAKELDELIRGLPGLMDQLLICSQQRGDYSSTSIDGHDGDGDGDGHDGESKEETKGSMTTPLTPTTYSTHGTSATASIRWTLSNSPRLIHKCLDRCDVHGAATGLIDLFSLIHQNTDAFPLANALANVHVTANGATATCNLKSNPRATEEDVAEQALLTAQMKMIYLHVQTLPSRTAKLSKKLLLIRSSSTGRHHGAKVTASALSALDLLDVKRHMNHMREKTSTITPERSESAARAGKLMDLYYDSKAKLIHGLLSQLSTPSSSSNASTAATISSNTVNIANTPMIANGNYYTAEATDAAEEILSKIVLILQYDVILHPYHIFVLRRFLSPNHHHDNNSYDQLKRQEQDIISSLPTFDPDQIKNKASHFLAAHLPLIRTKVKSVLMAIAGTTASRLGQIRQSLYDKTDGIECLKELDSNGLCTWDQAVAGMVDVRIVTHGLEGLTATTASSASTPAAASMTTTGTTNLSNTSTSSRKFSLWGTLFSNTFSSLVHSLLTSSFHSVHTQVLATLRASLANAPSPLSAILPHEAYRNTLRIASELDAALKKVSDDAHELLVHAEEREESERRLRQSLYVQTCEIMGRLLNELRRMLYKKNRNIDGGSVNNRRHSLNYLAEGYDQEEDNDDDDEETATKELILGRLCHLLKFRLTSLPTLLHPHSSPAVLSATLNHSSNASITGSANAILTGNKSGMITAAELRSSFEIADDDDDGLISFDEAMDAMEGAFSGTHFHGAEMMRETMLLSPSVSGQSSKMESGVGGGVDGGGATFTSPSRIGMGGMVGGVGSSSAGTPLNVTLSELILLSARGLRHDVSGPESALGTIQISLDNIVHACFKKWAKAALKNLGRSFRESCRQIVDTACSVEDAEWKRLHHLIKGEDSEEDLLQKEIGDALMEENVDHVEEEKKEENMMVPIGNVSPPIVSYLLSVASILNQTVCPADSLPPVPSLEYASAMGINTISHDGSSSRVVTTRNNDINNNKHEELTIIYTLRGALLRESLITMTKILGKEILATVEDQGDVPKTKVSLCGPTALIQLCLDVSFVSFCFFSRNGFGFVLTGSDASVSNDDEESNENYIHMSKSMLDQISAKILSQMKEKEIAVVEKQELITDMQKKHHELLRSCDLFLSSLFGEDKSSISVSLSSSLASPSIYDQSDTTSIALSSFSPSQSSSEFPAALSLQPLPSSRRFVLLPIQAERSISELQLLGKIGKDKLDKEAANKADNASSAASAVSSGFGFFSSMLGKK